MNRFPLCLPFVAALLLAVASAPVAKGQSDLEDAFVEVPPVDAAASGLLTDPLAASANNPTSMMTGSVAIPLDVQRDERFGPLLLSPFPVYTPSHYQTEWGVGWVANLALERVRDQGELDYSTDDLQSPWGRLVLGTDGRYYDKGLRTRVVVALADATATAYLPDGSVLTFGGDAVVAGPRTGTVFRWYLRQAVDPIGRAVSYDYIANSTGRLFLTDVSYGGRAGNWLATLHLSYETLTTTSLVSYRSGHAEVLDRRVRGIALRTRATADRSWQDRWSYELRYTAGDLGPAFFLDSLQLQYGSGAATRRHRFRYGAANTALATAAPQPVTRLQGLLGTLGAQMLSPRWVSFYDAAGDGRTSFEVARDHTRYVQTDEGFVVEPSQPAPGADAECLPPPNPGNQPRLIVRLNGRTSKPSVLVRRLVAGGSRTRIKVCDLDGTLLATQEVPGDFASRTRTVLIDLDHDGRPDILSLHGSTYRVLLNHLDGPEGAFVDAGSFPLPAGFAPNLVWAVDMNGDGLVDLVGKQASGLTVLYGTGHLAFAEHPVPLPLKTLQGFALNPEQYNVTFLDVNGDGLTDALLTRGDKAYLFVNDGSTLKAVDVPALHDRPPLAGYPTLANFGQRTPLELFMPSASQGAQTLPLTEASAGLLTRAEDDQGQTADLRYGFAAENGPGFGRAAVTAVVHRVPGRPKLTTTYSYADAAADATTGTFLGFGRVVADDDRQTASYAFRLDSATGGGWLQESRLLDKGNAGLTKVVTYDYTAGTQAGVPLLRRTAARTAWEQAGKGATAADLTTFNDFDATGCPSTQSTTGEHGRLDVTRTYAHATTMALRCLETGRTVAGRHADASLDFTTRLDFERNSDGQVTRVLTSAGGVQLERERYRYDELGRMIESVQPNGSRATYTYLADGPLITALGAPTGERETYDYNDAGLLIRRHVDRGGESVTYEMARDGQERLTAQWDSLHGTTQDVPSTVWSYQDPTPDRPAAVLQRTLIDRTGSTPRYSASATLTDAAGGAVANLKQASGLWRLGDLTTREDGSQTTKLVGDGQVDDPFTVTWSGLGSDARPLTTTRTSVFLPLTERETQVQAGVKRTETSTLAVENGKLVEAHATSGTIDGRWQLDRQLRPTAHAAGTGDFDRYEYDAAGRLRIVRLASGVTTTQGFDDFGRRVIVANALAGTQRSAFGAAFSQLKTAVFLGPEGSLLHGQAFAYDSLGRPASLVDDAGIDKVSFAFQYDGRLADGSTAAGQTGRLTTVKSDEATWETVFRADGKPLSKRLGLTGGKALVRELSYTDADRIASEAITVTGGAAAPKSVLLRYAYDGEGRLRQVVAGSQTIAVVRGPDGDVASLDFGAAGKLVIQRDPYTKRPAGASLVESGAAVTYGWRFGADGRVAAVTVDDAGSQVQRELTYDDQGFLRTASGADGGTAYAFDKDGLLATVKRGGQVLPVVRTGATVRVGDETYRFDRAGRLVATPDATFVYGALGALRRATTKAGPLSFIYDQDGRRVAKKNGADVVTIFDGNVTWDSGDLYVVVAIDGCLAGVLRNGQFVPVLTDQVGTLVKTAGEPVNLRSPFGESGSSGDLDLALSYGGHPFDPDLGLVHMALRDYLPALGQFATPDSSFLAQPERMVGRPYEANLVGYARNDPVDYFDPTGQNAFVFEDFEGAGGNGHVAVMAGNADVGYAFFSMGATERGSLVDLVSTSAVAAGVGTTFGNTPQEAYGRMQDLDRAQIYDRFIEIKTTPEQDRAMLTTGLETAKDPGGYNLLFNNCSHFVRDVLNAGGIDTPWAIRPNGFFESMTDAYGKGTALDHTPGVDNFQGPPAAAAAGNEN